MSSPWLCGRYEPLDELGTGMHGRVVGAFDHQHQRNVALKIRLIDQMSRDELFAEARALLTVRPHPGIALLRDDFVAGDEYVLVMDRIEGISLHEVLTARGDPGLAPSVVLDYVTQLAAALDHLHTHQPPIVHGDVKPANALLTPAGHVVLVDFGLAGSSRAAGTAGFIAPEVGAGGRPTCASDVFGLAATAIALLTGHPPINGRPTFEGIDAGVARALERGLRRGLAIDPGRRPATAGDLVERFRNALGFDLPSGVVTFCLARVDDPADEVQPGVEAAVVGAVEQHRGRHVGQRAYDGSMLAAFTSATDAARAALAIRRAVASERGTDGSALRAAVALHAGDATPRDGSYRGAIVNRVARFAEAANPGQILTSAPAAELIGSALGREVQITDLGRHRVSDGGPLERVFQLDSAGEAAHFPRLRTHHHAQAANNLPAAHSKFVGRADEITELRRVLGTARLVTVVGPGGVGKTRLAREVAAGLLTAQFDGVWLIELASLTDGAAVPARMAQALGLQDAGEAGIDALTGVLRDQRTLVVLDNCEHLSGACADLVENLLGACTDLRVLATSREPLSVDGEHVHRLAPLPVPSENVVSTRQLAGSGAVELFVDRIRSHGVKLELDNSNVVGVAAVCRRLDGIPLAIELAAARTPSMSIAEIDARLGDRFQLLAGGRRTAASRHQTLWATIDWSFRLLSPCEQAVLRRTSAFHGGFDLPAAEAVCGFEEVERVEVADAVRSLVDKSLLVADTGAEGTRYRLLEMIREFANDQLTSVAADEQDVLRTRHADHYAAWAQDRGACRAGPGANARIFRLEREYDNLRATFEHLATQPDRTADLLRTALAVENWLLYRRTEALGYVVPGLQHAQTLPRDLRGAALSLAALLSTQANNLAGFEYACEAVDIAREADDRAALAWALVCRAATAIGRAPAGEVAATAAEAVALARDAGNPETLVLSLIMYSSALKETHGRTNAKEVALEAVARAEEFGDELYLYSARMSAAQVVLAEGDVDGAAWFMEECAKDEGQNSLPGAQVTDFILGYVYLRQGRTEAATRRFLEAFAELCKPGSLFNLSAAALGLACVASTGAAYRVAAVLLGFSEHQQVASGSSETEPYVTYRRNSMAATRSDPGFEVNYRLGHVMQLGDALDFVLDNFPLAD